MAEPAARANGFIARPFPEDRQRTKLAGPVGSSVTLGKIILFLSALIALSPQTAAAPERVDVPGGMIGLFESIDALGARAEWAPLRQTDVTPGSLEIRLWVGFGTQPLRGIRLRRDGERWSGLYARAALPGEWPFESRRVRAKDWNDLWRKVKALGILSLPDSSVLPKEGFYLDGVGCAVEINDGGHYRAYHYSNPQLRSWPEARKIEKIVELVLDALARHDEAIISDWDRRRR